MLGDIGKDPSHIWKDLSYTSKTSPVQVISIEVIEKTLDDNVNAKLSGTVEVMEQVVDVTVPTVSLATTETIKNVSNSTRPASMSEMPDSCSGFEKPTESSNIAEVTKNTLHTAKPNPPRLTPKLESIYSDDVAFNRLLDLYLPSVIRERAESDLYRLADTAVSQQTLKWVADTENSPPQVQHWDAWGMKKDDLVTSQGWKNLWRLGISERCVV